MREAQTRTDDSTEPTIEWTNGDKEIIVSADTGTLHVDFRSPDTWFTNTPAELKTVEGRDALDAGQQRDDNGEKFVALVPIGDRREEIEQLREDSEIEQTDTPLAYEVVEQTKRVRGAREITKQKLDATKDRAEMTDRQRDLHRKVDTENDVPADAIAGDVHTVEDLLEDPRTDEEIEQDALDEAAETGEAVVLNKTTTTCNDPSKQCLTDKITRLATPEGEIETDRTHTY